MRDLVSGSIGHVVTEVLQSIQGLDESRLLVTLPVVLELII